jgi:hypothetical protein
MSVGARPSVAEMDKRGADQLGVLIALPLSEPAEARIRRVLASGSRGSRGSRSTHHRGLASSNRGGAAAGSVAAPPLQLVGRAIA